jgi:hypothetical protein
MTPPACCAAHAVTAPRRRAAATEKARMTVLRRERAIRDDHAMKVGTGTFKKAGTLLWIQIRI